MKRILCIVCGLILTTGAWAQEHYHHRLHHNHQVNSVHTEADSPNSPIYVGGSLGFSDTHWDPAFDSMGFGFMVLGGYRFDAIWSAEANVTHFADATNSINKINTNSIAAMAKITLPIGDTPFKFVSKMGFAETFTSGFISRNHFAPVFGVAAAVPINSASTVELGYTHFSGCSGSNPIENADFYGVSFTYFLPARLSDSK